jgi:hypothetical protein
MACVTADGSLTESAEAMLRNLEQPLTDREVAEKTGFPLYRVRSGLREMVEAGMVELVDGRYRAIRVVG